MNAKSDPDRPKGRLSRLAGAVTGRVVETIDPDIVVDNLDIDHVVDRIDVNRVLDRVDVDRLLERVDVNELLDRVAVDELLDRVDVDALLDRVDVDRLLDRVGVDALLERVDWDRVLARVDLEAAVRRAGVPEIVAESTGRMAGSALDLVRRQMVGLDIVVDRIVARLMRRDLATLPVGPEARTSSDLGQNTRPGVTGHYAGAVSRAAAISLDVGLIFALFTLGVAGLDLLARFFAGLSLADDRSGFWWVVALVLWAFIYVIVSLTIAGRTPGKGIVGLRVVLADGSILSGRHALARTLVFPLSAALVGLGFLGIVFGKHHRALHDVIAGTAVVYEWGGREAQVPGPLAAFLARKTGAI
jgi:uncharacterized RDD family membrane protein YckC